jgi:hypothetical protein
MEHVLLRGESCILPPGVQRSDANLPRMLFVFVFQAHLDELLRSDGLLQLHERHLRMSLVSRHRTTSVERKFRYLLCRGASLTLIPFA